MTQPNIGDLIFLYDRRCWGSLQTAWQAGLASRCPDGLDLEEWRASARRLAKHLDCTVRTGLKENGGHHVAIAVANDGYPLGLVDPYDRDRWERHQANTGD